MDKSNSNSSHTTSGHILSEEQDTAYNPYAPTILPNKLVLIQRNDQIPKQEPVSVPRLAIESEELIAQTEEKVMIDLGNRDMGVPPAPRRTRPFVLLRTWKQVKREHREAERLKQEVDGDQSCSHPYNSHAANTRGQHGDMIFVDAADFTLAHKLELTESSFVPKPERSAGENVWPRNEPHLGELRHPNVDLEGRLRAADCNRYQITDLTGQQIQFTFDRAFISRLYGGNTQSMFPKISTSKMRDGINNLAFINPQFNPLAPRKPGAPGLFFVLNPDWRGEMVKRLFVRLAQSRWLHLGTYRFLPSTSLTAAEFRTLSSVAKTTWARNTLSKGWGKPYVARIYLRAHNGGAEPSAKELQAILNNKAKFDACKQQVSQDQVAHAFHTGKEVLCVSCVKCIGYDANWQKSLIDRYPQFAEEERENRKRKNKEKAPARQVRVRRDSSFQPARHSSSPAPPSSRLTTRSRADESRHKRQLKAAGLDSDESDLSEVPDTDSDGEDSDVAEEAAVEAFLFDSD